MRSVRHLLFLLATVVAAACALPIAAAATGNGQNDPSSPAARISDVAGQTGVLQFVLSVADLPSGQTLDPKSILVTADGQTLDASASPVDATTTPKTVPMREVVLVLDVSGSMQGDGIAAARAAAAQYVRSLPRDVRVGVIAFSSSVRVLVAPTTDRGKVSDAVTHVVAGGDTKLYDALVAAAQVVGTLPASAERRLLLLSDGDDTSSARTLSDVTAALVNTHVSADVVAFRIPGQPKVLQAIAASSHGRLITAANAAALAGAFQTAAQAFEQRLLVSVHVPQALADQTRSVTASVNAGGSSISATATVKFPNVGGTSAARLVVSKPAGSSSNTQLAIVLAISFAGLLALALIALYLPLMRQQRMKKYARLDDVHRYRIVGAVGTGPAAAANPVRPNANSALAERTLSFVDKTVRAGGKRDALVSELDRAGLRMRPEEWAVIQVVAPLIAGALTWLLTGSFVGFIIGAVLGVLCVRAFIRHRISKRAAMFTEQLPDTLQLIVGSLRTGFSLNQAFAGVVREGSEPTASEFARALTEVRLGSELEDAIDGVAERMQCQDLGWVVMAIRIAREVGGNLGEVLTTTVATMRQRAEIRGLVKVLSAEGRISARILTALPFVVGGALALLRPGFLDPLFHSGLGIAMLVIGCVQLVLGTFWLSRIIKIEV